MDARVISLAFIALLVTVSGCGPPGFEAAGAFVYTERDGRLLVLFGEEPRARCGGWCWSDFVGGRKRVESRWEEPVETATRELHEESRHSYGLDEIRSAISGREPVAVDGGRVLIFVLRLDDRSADAMARRPDVADDEKSSYCWLDLEELLASADATDGDEIGLLAACGGESTRFFGSVLANLRRGGALRPSLDALLQE